ncbi:uncharacterized protein LY89DRAFT_274343 [Mollisia scopiformis]|uniref:Uncharacterized protein n=1 Tax=Mollisia scopiformis TaxID=149040 RepID=A0A132BB57_MOLSC|nr:uncharacterized protein LY89DRAFT_274343 [Mollisia scopiformis]KUJ09621.1 hypothetical protein LY89DRAFT_274343 [Mollisia scopiformis]
MDISEDVYVTSRSRTPSFIDVKSQSERVFTHLPDIIQEAIVSTEFSSPRLRISRVQDGILDTEYMTQPMFYITSRTDSGIDLPDLNVTDEKLLGKYGSDLTANFADIRAYGAKAFFEKENLSNGSKYSLCACATGYIWVSVTAVQQATSYPHLDDVEIQIGTYALKAKAITTVEIPCVYRCMSSDEPLGGEPALLFSTVLGNYLRNRMLGQQYEEATDNAIKTTRKELSSRQIMNPTLFGDFYSVLKEMCTNAPLPPTSDVSLISRSMITRRWQCWRESSILRKRYFFPQRIIRCLKPSRHDSIDLLSGCYMALASEKARSKVVSTEAVEEVV